MKPKSVYTPEEQEWLNHVRKMLRSRMRLSKIKQTVIAHEMGVSPARVSQIMTSHPPKGARDLTLINMRRALRACGFDLVVTMPPTEGDGAPKDSPPT